jgi:hypothetical protein
MEHGIHEQPSSLQMENTYIPELPNGTGNWVVQYSSSIMNFV